ncbi:MAG: hypothetical protein KGI06_05850 [Candidatus Micrarchaeota archaeon]|nr:hypothetical protein [Candidatus Micrarchaeota archaeon]
MTLTRPLLPLGDRLELAKMAELGYIGNISNPVAHSVSSSGIGYFPFLSYTPASGKTFYFLSVRAEVDVGFAGQLTPSVAAIRVNLVVVEMYLSNYPFPANTTLYDQPHIIMGALLGNGTLTADFAFYSTTGGALSSTVHDNMNYLVI